MDWRTHCSGRWSQRHGYGESPTATEASATNRRFPASEIPLEYAVFDRRRVVPWPIKAVKGNRRPAQLVRAAVEGRLGENMRTDLPCGLVVTLNAAINSVHLVSSDPTGVA